MKNLIRPIITTVFIISATILIILWGRGYRVDLGQKAVSSTGSLVATSDPNGAQVYIDGKFTTATNSTIQLKPGQYQVKIAKEGFIPWEKRLPVKGEVVSKADATLFPTNPSLSPLTSTGIINPVVSPDGSRIAFARDEEATAAAERVEKDSPAGLWVLDLTGLAVRLNRDPRLIAQNFPARIWNQAQLTWSPDGKQILAMFPSNTPKKSQPAVAAAFLLDADRINTLPKEVTTTYTTILSSWEEEQRIRDHDKLLGFPPEIIRIASSSMHLLSFSPDETKLLYEATASATLPPAITPALIGTNPTSEERTIKPGQLYVYDSKEDKNFPISLSSPLALLSPSLPLQWYPDSRHLVVTEDKHIAIMEFDGGNKTTVYAGPFLENFVAPWPGGGKLIILTTLNPSASTRPNLYLVNLR